MLNCVAQIFAHFSLTKTLSLSSVLGLHHRTDLTTVCQAEAKEFTVDVFVGLMRGE